MSNSRAKQKQRVQKVKEHKIIKKSDAKKSDVLFFIVATLAVVATLIFAPRLIAQSGLSFLSIGTSLNKLFSVIISILLFWLCLLPSVSYKNFIELAKGARIEWKKTIKPDKDTVLKTTMMVLALVVFFAILILILDWIFGLILNWLIT